GDVLVLGGRYRHGDAPPWRNPARQTLMYAGYERELRESLRDPTSILTPKLSAAYLGWRLLAVLFWLVVSLAFTAVSPGAVGRAAARLQLKSLRVAVVGLLAALAWLGLLFSLSFMPAALGLVVLAAALVLQVMSYLFGRVVIHAATGRWLQRLLLAEKNRSEAVALFLGALFWSVALALPYVWPFLVAGLVVTSLGLALTARYRVNWKRA
ncbi:MAG TPA: hypothetical protein VEQ42_00485, partial [Pyrinomonadaceae bacterium]|nr:hypothetical protein [Pyrinomonadaceae bacterium]